MTLESRGLAPGALAWVQKKEACPGWGRRLW